MKDRELKDGKVKINLNDTSSYELGRPFRKGKIKK